LSATTPDGAHPFTPAFWTGRVDLRSLGLFRITFGSFATWSVIDLAGVLRPFISEEGVLPRTVLLGGVARTYRFSIFDAAGPLSVTVALWLLTIISTTLLSLGWHSRIASVCSFILVSGLHERNPAAFGGAETITRCLLFWLMFMPSGARYSIDAVLRTARGEETITDAPAFTIRLGQIQIAWVYLNSFIYKWYGLHWRDGTALHDALNRRLYTTSLGRALMSEAWFYVPGTYLTLVFEAGFVFLVFAPIGQPRLRALALASCAAMHTAISATMNIGHFSSVMVLSYPLLFEARWTEAIARFCRRAADKLTASHAPRLITLWRLIAAGGADPGHGEPSDQGTRDALGWRVTAARLRNLLLALVMVGCIWIALPKELGLALPGTEARFESMPLPETYRALIQTLDLGQRWDMFSESRADSWFRGEGRLEDGTTVDVFRGPGGGELGPPAEPGLAYDRWIKWSETLNDGKRPVLRAYGRFICREWNTPERVDSAEELTAVELFRNRRPVPSPGEEPGAWIEQRIFELHCTEEAK
jgi:hypothetical protein